MSGPMSASLFFAAPWPVLLPEIAPLTMAVGVRQDSRTQASVGADSTAQPHASPVREVLHDAL
jgi:hypothetical protein